METLLIAAAISRVTSTIPRVVFIALARRVSPTADFRGLPGVGFGVVLRHAR
jgi:hypothetical protein